MSRSLDRVKRALSEAGLQVTILATQASTRTAAEAAAQAGCQLDQIVKSIIFRGESSGRLVLFLTAGGNRVDVSRAAALVGEPLGRADAALVRAETGFAIGGVAPVGHLGALASFLNPRLLEFDQVWAAAGTPHHIFAIAPQRLLALTGARVARFTETR